MPLLRPACAALLPALFAASLAQAQDGAALDRLPPETVGVIHLPDAGKWCDQMKTTQLGKTMMDAKRWEPVWNAIEKADEKGDLKKFRAEMARLKVTNDDLTALLKKDAGLAVVLLKNPLKKGEPLPLILAWSGCGQPLAEKMKGVYLDPKKFIDDKAKVARTDLSPAFTRLKFGEFKAARLAEDPATGAPGDDTHEELRLEKAEKPGYVYIAAQSGYLIGAILPTDSAKDEAELAQLEKIATPAVAQFLAAQGKPGAGAFSKRLMASPGVRQAVAKPGATPLFNVLLDTQALVKLARESHLADNPGKAAEADKLIKALGLDGMGPLVLSSSASPGRMNTSFAFDCPAPRRGLLRLLDQKAVAPQVPDWVGAEVIQYARYNFDMAAAFDIVVESLKAATTEEDAMQIDNSLAMANGAVAAQLGGVKLRDLLGSFGGAHHFLQYTPDPSAAQPQAGAVPLIAASALAGGKSAVVWPDANPEVWTKVMGAIGRFMNKPDAPFFQANEQDYSGWATKDTDDMPLSAGLFQGKGGLVLGLGKDAARNAITGLSTPGKHNRLLEDCRGILPPHNGWIHGFGDTRQTVKNSIANLRTGADANAPANPLHPAAALAGKMNDNKEILAALGAALPTDQEVDAMLGMSAFHGWTDAAGFHAESAVKLEPAK